MMQRFVPKRNEELILLFGCLLCFSIHYIVVSQQQVQFQSSFNGLLPTSTGSLQADTNNSTASVFARISPSDKKERIVSSHHSLTVPHEKQQHMHDSDSLTTFVWKRGIPLEQFQKEGKLVASMSNTNVLSSTKYIVDAATIGCHAKSDFIKAQLETWGGRGTTVRYFFGATETDDSDPTCVQTMTLDLVKNVSQVCSTTNRALGQESEQLTKSFYARGAYLFNRTNPSGWLCGNQRFASLLGKVGKFYQREAKHSEGVLPDFLLIQDDDTYFNLELLEKDIFSKVDPEVPFATAGCLVHMPIHMMNFSFPFGGFGTILSRATVQRLTRPIFCNDTTIISGSGAGTNSSSDNDSQHGSSRNTTFGNADDEYQAFLNHACFRIEKNTFGEKSAFRNGMSVSDLMRAHATANPYRNVEDWRHHPGYCFHGDWIVGYYLNYYNLALPSILQPKEDLPYFNLDKSLGYIYGSKKPLGNCQHEGENCPSTAHICHRQNPESMGRLIKTHGSNLS